MLSADFFKINFLKTCNQLVFYILNNAEIFLGLIWGRLMASSQFKNEQKLPKMVYIIHNFLVLHFGENFMKIRSKIPKLQMHKNCIKM